MANQKYSSIKNDYCIVFDKSAQITECGEDESIQEVGFSFVSVDEINDLEQAKTVDTIGIITNVQQITQINVKSTG